MKKLLPLLLVLAGCISDQQWRVLKSHALETGTATVFGAIAVFVGGPIGLAVAGAGMGVGAAVGEIARPPAQVLEHTKTTDKDGKTTESYEYKTPKQGGETNVPDTGFLHSITSWFSSLVKIGIAIAVAVWLLTHPWAIEKLVGVGMSGVQLVKSSAKTVQKGLHPIAMKKRAPPAPPAA